MPASSAAASSLELQQSLAKLSALLQGAGFAQLPPTALQTDPHSLTQQQELSQALYRAAETVVEEYSVKVQLIQSLTAKANTVLEQTAEITDRYEKMLAERDGRLAMTERVRETERLQLQRMQDSLQGSSAQQQQLSAALAQATDENDELKRERHRLQLECEAQQGKLAQLDERLANSEREERNARQRAQDLVGRFLGAAAGSQKPPVVLREVQEVVSYYEDRLARLGLNNSSTGVVPIPKVSSASSINQVKLLEQQQQQHEQIQSELLEEIKVNYLIIRQEVNHKQFTKAIARRAGAKFCIAS
jgi:chromosome segregation ATPase